MKPRLLAFVLVIATFVTLIPRAPAAAYTIPSEAGSWNHSMITVQITPANTMSWFRSSFTDDVSHAVRRWSQSIVVFTDSYGSLYLRQLQFTLYITGFNQTLSPDIQVSFTQYNQSFLGVTRFRVSSGYFQKPVTVTLTAYESTNTRQLSDNDMTNIATHEFGHTLGLDHALSVQTGDGNFELMFKDYQYAAGSLTNPLLPPSSLDIYALSQIYSWLPTGPPLIGPGATTYSLPASIPYTLIVPYQEQINNLTNTIESDDLKLLVLAVVVVFFFAATVILAIFLARRKPAQPQPFIVRPQVPSTP